MGRKPATSTRALAWGYNNLGGLGAGHTARALRPVPARAVPAHTIDLQGGTDFTVALTDSGELFTWGGNSRGQLGAGDHRSSRTARRVTLPPLAAISAGAGHVLAVTRNGDLFGWGDNRYGQVGDGSTVSRNRPVRIASVGRGARVATGTKCSMVVSASGHVSLWGDMIAGTSTASTSHHHDGVGRPLRLPAGRAAQVDAGEQHLVVLDRDGSLFGCGVDVHNRPVPERLRLDRSWGTVISICAGDYHTVALTDRGTVLTWGANTYGQLGLRNRKDRPHPTAVTMPRDVGRIVQVMAAGNVTLARTDAHHVFAWGHGELGQTGLGTTKDQLRPMSVKLPDHLTAASLHPGRFHALALTRPQR